MPWNGIIQAGIGAAGSIGGALINRSAAEDAAKAQGAGYQNSSNFQQGILGQTTANVQPYIDAGQNALAQLRAFYGLPGGDPNAVPAYQAFTQTPGYQFPLQQGQLALDRGMSKRGLLLSGGADKDAVNYNQGYASSNFQNYIQQLAALASGGQNASLGLGTQGVATGANVGNAMVGLGGANSSGIVGGANALTGGLGQLIGGLTTAPSANNNFGQSPLGRFGTWIGNQFTANPNASSYPSVPLTSSGAYPAGDASQNWYNIGGSLGGQPA